MIIGIGTDLVNIEVFKYRAQRSPALLKKLIGSEMSDSNLQDIARAAKNFAAYEALYKALPVSRRNLLLKYKLSRSSSGTPIFRLADEQVAEKFNAEKIHVSIADHGNNAIAFVIIESDND